MLFLRNALTMLVLAASPAWAGSLLDQPAPSFTLQTYAGETVSLQDFEDQIVVLEWFDESCEFVADHYEKGAGHMPMLQAETVARGAIWLTIDSSANASTSEQMLSTARRLNMASSKFLSDPLGVVGKQYGASTSLHMVVVDHGTVVYVGAIDNRPSLLGFLRDRSTALNYVQQAVSERIAAEPVSVPETKPYGCRIKYGQ